MPFFKVVHEPAETLKYAEETKWFPGTVAETADYGIYNTEVKAYNVYLNGNNLIIKSTEDKYTNQYVQYQQWGKYFWNPMDLTQPYNFSGEFGSTTVKMRFDHITESKIEDKILEKTDFTLANENYSSLKLQQENTFTGTVSASNIQGKWTLFKKNNSYKLYLKKQNESIQEGKY